MQVSVTLSNALRAAALLQQGPQPLEGLTGPTLNMRESLSPRVGGVNAEGVKILSHLSLDQLCGGVSIIGMGDAGGAVPIAQTLAELCHLARCHAPAGKLVREFLRGCKFVHADRVLDRCSAGSDPEMSLGLADRYDIDIQVRGVATVEP